MASAYKFILVHGAWHDGLTWNEVADHLRRDGHQVWAPTIGGHGRDAKRDVTHDQCVASLVDYIVDQDLNDIVLVGHSLGGSFISRAAPKVAERLRRLVFLNAFVPLDGESLLTGTPQAEMLAQLAAASGDNSMTLPFAVWRDGFINDADFETATWAYQQLSPQPYGLAIEKLDMKAFYVLLQSGRLPCSYLNCTEDNVLPWLSMMAIRLGFYRLVQMPGSHETLFSNPAGLARKLVEAGRD